MEQRTRSRDDGAGRQEGKARRSGERCCCCCLCPCLCFCCWLCFARRRKARVKVPRSPHRRVTLSVSPRCAAAAAAAAAVLGSFRMRIRIGSDRNGWVRWSGNGGGGPVTAGSPEEDRTEEVAKARRVRLDRLGRSVRESSPRRRAGPRGPGGRSRNRRTEEESSGAECGGVRDDRVCEVQGSVHSGRRAQESSQSDRR